VKQYFLVLAITKKYKGEKIEEEVPMLTEHN
jgi:hypothetical protein